MTGSQGRPDRVCVLGPFAATRAGTRIRVRPSAQRLLAALAVLGPLRREAAAAALWPASDPVTALGNLRNALHRLRQDAPGVVTVNGAVLHLAEIDTDFAAVRSWAWGAVRGEGDWAGPPDVVGQDILPSWDDEWLVQPREEFRLSRIYALESAAQRLLAAGRFGESAGLAAAAVRADPLRESANRLLIEAHLRNGNRFDALSQYAAYRDLLAEELDTSPGRAVTALVTGIGSGAMARAQRPGRRVAGARGVA
jgi:DNA-binding SARP family transcriptional activator